MPHITIAASTHLSGMIDWPAVLTAMHREIADRNLVALGDLKSRVQHCGYALVGDDAAGEQLVATLVTTNQRPDAAQREMAEIVIAHLGRAAKQAGDSATQCCVFFHYVPKTNYLRQDI